MEPIWDLFGIRLVLARMITRFLPTQLKEGISIKLAITALLLALVFGPALAWIDDHKPNYAIACWTVALTIAGAIGWSLA